MPAPTSPRSPSPSVPAPPPARRPVRIVAGLLVLAVLVAYANSLGGAFVFDDIPSIRDNPTIRQLWPLSVPLSPPVGLALTVCGRPLLNLSLALNHALGGLSPVGYHVVNLLIHCAAALAAFGLVRRTLPRWRPATTPRDAALCAGAIAGLWALHPVLTESVTYIVQRAESLTGLLTLFALYAVNRTAEAARPWRWRVLAVGATFAAVATKEIGVAIPVLAVLYDRTFLAGSWRAVWRERRWLHLALLSSWLLLAWLSFAEGDRGGTAVLDPSARWAYWFTEGGAVAHYLRLAFWPHPLVFEYGYHLVPGPLAVLPQILLVGALAAATLLATWRRHPAGFLGCWFFIGIAPASLTPNTIQLVVEHRLYLPLLAPLALVVAWAFARGGVRWLAPFAVLALVGGGLTAARNRDYRSELALWSDTVAKCPEGARAWASLGAAWYNEGKFEKALECSQRAAEIDPALPAPHINLGLACEALGRIEEAARHFTAALRLNPRFATAQTRLAFCLMQLGRDAEAIDHLRRALETDPGDPTKHLLLGIVLERGDQFDEAVAEFARTTGIDPRSDQAESSWGTALLRRERFAEAIPHLERSLALRARQPLLHEKLATALLALGRPDEAFAHYDSALALQPDDFDLRMNYGLVLARARRLPAARAQFARLVERHPDSAQAHTNLGSVLSELHEPDAAREQYEASIRIEPDNALAHYNLANVLLRLDRIGDARTQFAAALRLDPSLTRARQILAEMEQVLGPAPQ